MVPLITELIGRGLHRFGHRIECLGKRMERLRSSPVKSCEDALLGSRVSRAIKDRFGHYADCLEVLSYCGRIHLRGCVPEEWHSAIIEFARQVEAGADVVDELEYCTPVT